MRTSILALLLVASFGCNGPFVLTSGGALEGEVTPVPADWSFTDEVNTIQLETNPEEPYSVNLWLVALGERVYVHAGTSRSRWVEHLEGDPRARLKVEDSLYELAASRVETQEEFDRFSDAYEAKYGVRPRNENVADVYLFALAPR